LLLATNNAGKVCEYREILGDLPLTLVTPAELGLGLNVEETGQTYEQNALLKARAYAKVSGLPALADDSGLEVDALDGAPGVRSARYDGRSGSDTDRYRILLQHLDGVAPEKRGARFRCVIAIATPDGRTFTCEGVCPGLIGTEPSGTGGFGYDPVFVLPELGRTMAELSSPEKNRLSHRGRAGRKARPILLQLLPETPEPDPTE
jgi:XTP/dITP diphosphohydrolase